jgi:hypothetical protein
MEQGWFDVPQEYDPKALKRELRAFFIRWKYDKKIHWTPIGWFLLTISVLVITKIFVETLALKESDLQLAGNIPNQFTQGVLPTPTPKPIPSGTQLYRFSHGSEVVGPKIKRVEIDPLDPAIGANQKLTVTISHTALINHASLWVQTDNESIDRSLKLVEGDTYEGTWEGEWTISDSYDYNYYFSFDLRSDLGDYQGGLRIR